MLAYEWAIERQMPTFSFPAEWNRLGKSAGYLRNKQMLDIGSPDLAVAFPGGAGTQNMIGLLEKAGIKIIQLKEK